MKSRNCLHFDEFLIREKKSWKFVYFPFNEFSFIDILRFDRVISNQDDDEEYLILFRIIVIFDFFLFFFLANTDFHHHIER